MARDNASQRARRLIALLGMLESGSVYRFEDLAVDLGTTPAQIAEDLTTLSMCGVAPYYPDQLVPLYMEDGTVEVFGSVPAMRGRVRLSAREAEALVAALTAAGFSAGHELVGKLTHAASSSFDADELARTLRAGAASHEPGIFEALAGAIREREVLAIAYQRDGAPEPGLRRIEPLQLFADRGAWYLWAWCREAGDYRTFRVDRIRGAEQTGGSFDPARRADIATSPTAFSGENLPCARLRFAPAEQFIEREWPGGRMVETAADGSVIADVPYAGTDWIARRVVARMGRVEAVGPAEVRAAVAELARELLAER